MMFVAKSSKALPAKQKGQSERWNLQNSELSDQELEIMKQQYYENPYFRAKIDIYFKRLGEKEPASLRQKSGDSIFVTLSHKRNVSVKNKNANASRLAELISQEKNLI